MGNIIAFWKVGSEYGVFSNWYLRYMIIHAKRYNSVEQYMMYQKAMLFGDEEIADEIMQTYNMREIKALGRKVRNFDNKKWDEVKYDIVLTAVKAKFTQYDDLKEILLETGDAEIVEASPYDRIWGIGTNRPHEIMNKQKWKGQNLLGKVLMQVREELKNG